MLTLLLLCVFAYFAGLIDATVGGGGLIQIPALFNFSPSTAPAALLGTNKFASACGTASAARTFVRKVQVPWSLVLHAAVSAFGMAFVGAATVSLVSQSVMRPTIFFLLIAMAFYTFWKKDFGKLHKPARITHRERILAVMLGGVIGFYDGLFGPGTGSFLVFMFIRYFAFDFVHASASSKVVNLATNLAALVFFIPAGQVLYEFALPMAACNVLGAISGTWIAVRKGSGFIRALFLILLSVLIVKMGYDIFYHD
jgi:uncharacterized membrane protein YfcA